MPAAKPPPSNSRARPSVEASAHTQTTSASLQRPLRRVRTHLASRNAQGHQQAPSLLLPGTTSSGLLSRASRLSICFGWSSTKTKRSSWPSWYAQSIHSRTLSTKTAQGEDETGGGKFSYSSVADFDHRGLQRLWKATRRQAMEWLEALGAATPLTEAGEVKKPRATTRKQPQGSQGGRAARMTRVRVVNTVLKPQAHAAPAEVCGMQTCGGGDAKLALRVHDRRRGLGAGSRLTTKGGSWCSRRAAFRPAGRFLHVHTLQPRMNACKTQWHACNNQGGCVFTQQQVPQQQQQHSWEFLCRFERVVDHHVAHEGQRVHLIYLVNNSSGARLLVAQGRPLHPSSSMYAHHNHIHLICLLSNKYTFAVVTCRLTYSASDCVGGYQLQGAAEALQYAAHLLTPPEGPSTPAAGSVRAVLDTVRAPAAAAASTQQRAISPSVQVPPSVLA